MGVVMTLILAVLLTQSRIVAFFINTFLGRMLLLFLIIFITCTNNMLGLLSVLFVIIAFNNTINENIIQSYNYYEGFDSSNNDIANSVMQDKLSILQAKEDILKKKIDFIKQNPNSSQTTDDGSTTATTTSTAVSGTETFKGREGFCMTDRETTMLRGKQSKTVPTFKHSREQPDDVNPSDSSNFTSDYASF